MKLQFLGTGAADWNLGFYERGEEGRRFSSALVDGRLLIDPGPHIYHFAGTLGSPDMFRGVTDIILTHGHPDHFDPAAVRRLTRESASPEKVRFWACAPVFAALGGAPAEETPDCRPLTLFETEDAGGYTVVPCPANHPGQYPGEQPFNYVVSRGGRSFFYGSDSGWIMYTTWQQIKKYRPNAVIFEATLGDVPGDDRVFGHTSVPMIAIMLQTMRRQKGIADDARIYTTHMARTLHGTHAQTERMLSPLGAVPAYDGLEIEI